MELFLLGYLVGAVTLLPLLLALRFGVPWVRSLLSRRRMPTTDVVGLRLRGHSPTLIVDAYLALLHAGVTTSLSKVESVYITYRGRVENVQELVDRVRQEMG